MFHQAMMDESVWFDRPKYEEDRSHYQLFLNNNLSMKLASTHASGDQADAGIIAKATQVAAGAGSALINEIAKARDSIKQSLSGMATTVTHAVTAESDANISSLAKENEDLKKMVEQLAAQVSELQVRVTKLEGGKVESKVEAKQPAKEPAKEPAKKEAAPAKKDDDSDDDFFAMSDDEEETEEEKKRKEEALARYHEKKNKKPQLIPKSNIILDVKPWDDETDMAEIERVVRGITLDGLLWGASKLVPLAYGIKKLQISCVVEDDKCGTDILEEKITAFEELVQSVDVAAFNKV